MAGQMARREAGAMPLRIVTDEATPPDAPPRPCPRGLRRLSPAAASRRSGQYRRGYSHFACSLLQTKIIRNATPSGFGIGSGIDPRWQPVVSAPLLQEYAEQIHDPRHTPYWTTAERDDFLDYLCASARWCEIHFLWRPLLPDEDDHLVLEAAVASAAQVIVTFNKRDLAAAEDFGIALMTPRQFLLSLSS
jgi:predicted nucleic acid-binding protein